MRRFGGDSARARRDLEKLAGTRDRVLDGARLEAGETVLDAGCGDGLIAFGAIERGAAQAIFADVSQPLLDDAREVAAAAGVLDRCRFVLAPAEDLAPVADDAVDLVTTRSVLIYVKEKRRAFEEFHRVLRPAGRISLFEPINRFGCNELRRDSFCGYDVGPLTALAEKLNAVYDAIQPLDSDPMLDFDERDLVSLAESAGFFPVHLELRADVEASESMPWETFLHRAGNPRIPTLAEAMDEALTPAEVRQVEEHLRPRVEQGRGVWRLATAYLVAHKPEVG